MPEDTQLSCTAEGTGEEMSCVDVAPFNSPQAPFNREVMGVGGDRRASSCGTLHRGAFKTRTGSETQKGSQSRGGSEGSGGEWT